MAGEKFIVASVLCGLLILQSTSGYLIFTIEPQPLIALYTEELAFHCAATNATVYQWLLDGTHSYSSDSDIDTTTYTAVENSVKVSTLTIHPPQNADKLNYTFVQCVAIHHITESSTAEYNKSKEALLQVQGKLDPPIISGVLVDCSSRTINISWDEPETLPGIPVTGYEVDSGEDHNHVRNTSLSWTGNISIAEATTCIEVITKITALTTDEEKGNYAVVNSTYTQGAKIFRKDQVVSKVVFDADNQSFEIQYLINFNETDLCHIPSAYNVTVHYPNSNEEERFVIHHVEFGFEDDQFKQNFSVHVTGQLTDAFSELEPQNCMGSNSSIQVINGLFHLQSVELNNSYINCTFVEGSNATGCETVSTCNTSIYGMAESLPVPYLIRLDPSIGYATGKIVPHEISDCLTYDVSVYEVLPNGSMGPYAARVFSNITVEPGSLSTSNYDGLPTLSPSSLTIAPTENSQGAAGLIILFAISGTPVFLFCILFGLIIDINVLYYKVRKIYKRRRKVRINPYS